jgi:5'-AMP-activated protein kinase catalytic alpha subunit
MTEVYKALMSLGCKWHPVTNYRVLVLHRFDLSGNGNGNGAKNGGNSSGNTAAAGGAFPPAPPSAAATDCSDNMDMVMGTGEASAASSAGRMSGDETVEVKVALSLYKVQQSIYLLDFQRIEGDAFDFMKLCAMTIAELKNLSAASRVWQAQLAAQQAAQQQAHAQEAPPGAVNSMPPVPGR